MRDERVGVRDVRGDHEWLDARSLMRMIKIAC